MKNILPRYYTGFTDEGIQEYEIRHAQLSRRAASEGIVLMKNEACLLPLDPNSPIALYGSGVKKTVKGGSGSGEVNARSTVSIFDGMKNAGFNIVNEEYIADYDRVYNNAKNKWHTMLMEKFNEYADGAMFFENVYSKCSFPTPPEAAFEKFDAETALYVLSRIAGEGHDRDPGKGDYLLSHEEELLLGEICGNYKNVVVVLNVGGVVDLSFMDKYENIFSLLLLSQPGSEGGNALADVLCGKVCPSGKLSDSWAYKYEDYPCATEFSRFGNVLRQEYREGIYVGYRWFDSFDIPVRYCFGHGLSYTCFEFNALSLEFCEGIIKTSICVRNSGSMAGKDVVQLYASCPDGRLQKEFRRLVGYSKTSLLNPGESQTLEIEIPLDALSSFDQASPGWVLEKGDYVFWLGNSLSSAAPFARLWLKNDVVAEETANLCAPESDIKEFIPANKKTAKLSECNFSIELSSDCIPCIKHEYDKAEARGDEAEAIAARLDSEQLIRMVCGDPGKSQTANVPTDQIYVPGAAAETSSAALDEGVVSLVLADGPAGLRLSKFYDVKNDKIVPRGFLASLEDGALCPDTGIRGKRYYQYCTAFPVGTLLAQTWNKELQQEVGAAVAEEMSLFNVNLWLAPGMNIHRNPLCGRNFEYYSEDPFLSGCTAAAVTSGVQSVKGCGVTIKHFAANNAEDERMHSDSVMSERALREIYLKGFEIAVKHSAPMAIMSSYNKLNGVHTANSADLCTAIARDEWGFDGIIMTDWTITFNAGDCSPRDCILAGNDLMMPGDERDFSNLRASLADGSLPLEKLRLCAARVIRTALKSTRYQ